MAVARLGTVRGQMAALGLEKQGIPAVRRHSGLTHMSMRSDAVRPIQICSPSAKSCTGFMFHCFWSSRQPLDSQRRDHSEELRSVRSAWIRSTPLYSIRVLCLLRPRCSLRLLWSIRLLCSLCSPRSAARSLTAGPILTSVPAISNARCAMLHPYTEKSQAMQMSIAERSEA
jgi:hypothetical protein